MFYFFFFKQKTAYEMRISDWSSDVCSSDLRTNSAGRPVRSFRSISHLIIAYPSIRGARRRTADRGAMPRRASSTPSENRSRGSMEPANSAGLSAFSIHRPARTWRSEEHTSELQSLMRHSYAVFCLKKKKINKKHTK